MSASHLFAILGLAITVLCTSRQHQQRNGEIVKMRRTLIVLFAVIMASTFLAATPITYTFNQTFGSGSVTGSLTTDGTLGVLNAADLLDWTLTLNDGTNTTVLLTSNSSFGSGLHDTVGPNNVDLTATATNLLF